MIINARPTGVAMTATQNSTDVSVSSPSLARGSWVVGAEFSSPRAVALTDDGVPGDGVVGGAATDGEVRDCDTAATVGLGVEGAGAGVGSRRSRA